MVGSIDLRRRARRHAAIHVAMAAVLVAVILPLTLHAASSGPPAIAEFAPQALQQIRNAPNNQALGAQGGLKATPTPTPTPTPVPGGKGAAGATPSPTPAIQRGRVRQCVGTPPRQIEDPQSPPCVPYFQGDNGGATDPQHGVTATTVTVATYDSDPRITADLVSFFNQRFEMYGRQLVAQPGPSPSSTCATRQSDADAVAAMPAFASTDSVADGETCYDDELGRKGVINMTIAPLRTEAQLAAQAPYGWQYDMALDQEMVNLGRWACQRLVPGNAVHSGDPSGITQTKPRKFGALVETGITSHTPDVAPLNAELNRCGASVDKTTEVLGAGTTADMHKTALIDLQNKGVTSIFCFCVVFAMQDDPAAAESQGYFPEWLMSSYGSDDINVAIHDFWPSETNELMGVTFNPMQVPYADLPLVWAVHAVDPSYAFTNSLDVTSRDNLLYHSLLLICSGIQMAGPHLTAATFEHGLQATAFPNPSTPIMAGSGQDAVLDTARRIRAENIPCSALWVWDYYDDATNSGCPVTMAEPPGVYGDLPRMIGALHGLGFRALGYLNPLLPRDTPWHRRAVAGGWAVRDAEGCVEHSSYFHPWHQRPGEAVIEEDAAALLDFTHPAARRAWEDNVRRMLEMGWDGWMEDFGEQVRSGSRLADGTRGDAAHNRYVAAYHAATARAVRRAGRDDAVWFARAGCMGDHAHVPAVWPGDQRCDWTAERGIGSILSAGLSAGLMGAAAWGPDIPGFTDGEHGETGDRELWLRWLQLGALSPVMRTHLGFKRGTPAPVGIWTDEGTVAAFRYWASLHVELQPYICALAEEASRTGIPIMRPMAMEFPDSTAWTESTQYMLGPAMLVAPVLHKGAARRTVDLPPGTWRDMWTGTRMAGDRAVEVEAPVERIPLFLRDGWDAPVRLPLAPPPS